MIQNAALNYCWLKPINRSLIVDTVSLKWHHSQQQKYTEFMIWWKHIKLRNINIV